MGPQYFASAERVGVPTAAQVVPKFSDCKHLFVLDIHRDSPLRTVVGLSAVPVASVTRLLETVFPFWVVKYLTPSTGVLVRLGSDFFALRQRYRPGNCTNKTGRCCSKNRRSDTTGSSLPN